MAFTENFNQLPSDLNKYSNVLTNILSIQHLNSSIDSYFNNQFNEETEINLENEE